MIEAQIENKFFKLGELFKITSGGTPLTTNQSYYLNGTIPWIKTGDLKQRHLYQSSDFITKEGLENSSAKIFPKNTVLLAMYGATIGACSILKIDAATNQACAAFLPNPKVNPEYLYFFLTSIKQQLINKGVGGGQPNISGQILKEVKISLPTLEEQIEIVSILEQADAARQKRKQANQLTEQFLQSAFLEMFGDPVRNEKGWEVKLIEDISTKVSSGSTPLGGASVYQTEGITFIRSQNVLMNKFDYSDVAYISNEIHNEMKRTWLKTNDVLLNITGASIGRTAVYKGDNDMANVNQHVCIIRPDYKKVNPDFLSFLISIPTFQDSINSNNSGATRQAFNFEQIKKFKIPLPPPPLQQKFAALVEQVERLRTKQRESERELDNLFQSLMQRYFG